MRFIAVLSLLVPLAGLLCAPASADRWHWACLVGAGGEYSASVGEFGADTSSLDGYDANDGLVVPGPTAYCATYHANTNDADGWTGPAGFYRWDFIAPLSSVPGSSYTWRFYVWADPTAFGAQIHMDVGFLVPASSGVVGSLTLVGRPASINSGPAIGTVWDVNGSAVQPVFLPMFKSADGRDGYIFDLTTTVIPEPSSLAALACGLAGVGGALVRRKQRCR